MTNTKERDRKRRYKLAHPERVKAANNKWRSERPGYVGPKRQAVTDEINRIKSSTPCADCKQKFPACCMDFDHVRGEKVAGVGALVGSGKSLEVVMAEVEKCELVCANCHRIRTWNRSRPGHKGQELKDG